jgi:hypothetical protein
MGYLSGGGENPKVKATKKRAKKAENFKFFYVHFIKNNLFF